MGATARVPAALVVAGVVLAGGVLGLTGCGTGAGSAAADPVTTTTEPPRHVPPPVGGALSAAVEPWPDDGGGDAAGAGELLVFGDSVAVLIADELARSLDQRLVVDGIDCRRLDLGFAGPCGGVPAGTSVAPALDDLAPAASRLAAPDQAAAVLLLANNAALAAGDLDAAMAALAPLPRVWWVTTRVEGRAWQDPNNALLTDLAARDPRAGVVDWFAASDGEGWLADNVHPDDEGQAALADLVADHVRCDCTP